jgi:hypothetical protein
LGDVVTLRCSGIDGAGYITRAQRKSSKDETLYCPEVLTEVEAWKRELRATHRPLALPGRTATATDAAEAADRERLAVLVRTTMPIADVRRTLAGPAGG